ncbi:hypothetical protein GE09DRAFT_1063949 [Coniochaeta sp. 2T2.1]|nr:hypothetical protein GE09DRAFT_1063949 [Coniochaeta sp. 2T2.1]
MQSRVRLPLWITCMITTQFEAAVLCKSYDGIINRMGRVFGDHDGFGGFLVRSYSLDPRAIIAALPSWSFASGESSFGAGTLPFNVSELRGSVCCYSFEETICGRYGAVTELEQPTCGSASEYLDYEQSSTEEYLRLRGIASGHD